MKLTRNANSQIEMLRELGILTEMAVEARDIGICAVRCNYHAILVCKMLQKLLLPRRITARWRVLGLRHFRNITEKDQTFGSQQRKAKTRDHCGIKKFVIVRAKAYKIGQDKCGQRIYSLLEKCIKDVIKSDAKGL